MGNKNKSNITSTQVIESITSLNNKNKSNQLELITIIKENKANKAKLIINSILPYKTHLQSQYNKENTMNLIEKTILFHIKNELIQYQDMIIYGSYFNPVWDFISKEIYLNNLKLNLNIEYLEKLLNKTKTINTINTHFNLLINYQNTYNQQSQTIKAYTNQNKSTKTEQSNKNFIQITPSNKKSNTIQFTVGSNQKIGSIPILSLTENKEIAYENMINNDDYKSNITTVDKNKLKSISYKKRQVEFKSTLKSKSNKSSKRNIEVHINDTHDINHENNSLSNELTEKGRKLNKINSKINFHMKIIEEEEKKSTSRHKKKTNKVLLTVKGRNKSKENQKVSIQKTKSDSKALVSSKSNFELSLNQTTNQKSDRINKKTSKKQATRTEFVNVNVNHSHNGQNEENHNQFRYTIEINMKDIIMNNTCLDDIKRKEIIKKTTKNNEKTMKNEAKFNINHNQILPLQSHSNIYSIFNQSQFEKEDLLSPPITKNKNLSSKKDLYYKLNSTSIEKEGVPRNFYKRNSFKSYIQTTKIVKNDIPEVDLVSIRTINPCNLSMNKDFHDVFLNNNIQILEKFKKDNKFLFPSM